MVSFSLFDILSNHAYFLVTVTVCYAKEPMLVYPLAHKSLLNHAIPPTTASYSLSFSQDFPVPLPKSLPIASLLPLGSILALDEIFSFFPSSFFLPFQPSYGQFPSNIS